MSTMQIDLTCPNGDGDLTLHKQDFWLCLACNHAHYGPTHAPVCPKDGDTWDDGERLLIWDASKQDWLAVLKEAMKNHRIVIPLGGWWNSRGIGGPDEWHYLARRRMGGGHFWTRCEEYMTMSRPRVLYAVLGDRLPVCQKCRNPK